MSMKVIVTKKDALRVLSRALLVADKKSTMPLLAGVLVSASDGVVRVVATDLFTAVSSRFAAEVAHPGAVVFPAKDLADRIKAMPEGPIEISVNGETARIKSVGLKREFKVRVTDGADFPKVMSPEKKADKTSIAPGVLAGLIEQIACSISGDQTRPHLNSALVEWRGGKLRMVSTDGHRLSLAEVACKTERPSMLVSQKAIALLRSFCDEAGKTEGAEISIAADATTASFSSVETTLTTRLVDAVFPPYEQVIPATCETTVRAPRAELAQALRAVAVSANDRTGVVAMKVEPGHIALFAESPDAGDARDEVAIEYSGKPIAVGFSARYMLDVLGALSCDDVQIGLGGELDPIRIEPAGGEGFVAVVMPYRM